MADYAITQEIAAFAQEFTDDSTVADTLATAASRLFDKLCEVEDDFFAPAGDTFTAKTFYGDGSAYLRMPPYTALNDTTPVVIVSDDGVTQTVPTYFEKDGFLVIKGHGYGTPALNVDEAPPLLGNPWSTIDPIISPTNRQLFNGWPENLKITVSAKWGFSETPADVKYAVIQLAIHLWRMSDPAFTAISQSGQPYQPPAVPNQVKEIADKYVEQYSGAVVFA